MAWLSGNSTNAQMVDEALRMFDFDHFTVNELASDVRDSDVRHHPRTGTILFRNDGCHVVDKDHEHNSIKDHAFEYNSHEDSENVTYYQKSNFFISKTPNAPEQTSQPVVATSRFLSIQITVPKYLHYA